MKKSQPKNECQRALHGEGSICTHLQLVVKCGDCWSEDIRPGPDRGATVPVVCAPRQDAQDNHPRARPCAVDCTQYAAHPANILIKTSGSRGLECGVRGLKAPTIHPEKPTSATKAWCIQGAKYPRPECALLRDGRCSIIVAAGVPCAALHIRGRQIIGANHYYRHFRLVVAWQLPILDAPPQICSCVTCSTPSFHL